MAFKTLCPGCGQKLKIEDNMVGESVRCPSCAHRFTVASLSNAGAETLESAAAANLTRASGSEDNKPGTGWVSASRSVATGKPARTRVRAQPSIGQFGRFELKRALGQGGFGTVYLAYDPVLDRSVAPKVPKFTPDQARLIERFVREGKAAANLHHPNIVAVFESGRAGDDYYIASEFVSGRPLSGVIKEHVGPLSLTQSALWVRELARALDYAHGQELRERRILGHDPGWGHAGDIGVHGTRAGHRRAPGDSQCRHRLGRRDSLQPDRWPATPPISAGQ